MDNNLINFIYQKYLYQSESNISLTFIINDAGHENTQKESNYGCLLGR